MADAIKPVEQVLGREPDPFNLKNLIMDQSYLQTAGTTKITTTIRIGKPNRQEFFRINPNPEFQKQFGILADKTERGFYIVHPCMGPELLGEFYMARVYVGVTKQETPFVWPIRLPGEDGRQMDWHRTEGIAAQMATTRWVRIAANMAAGYNDIHVADMDLGEPKWLDLPYTEILRIAFRPEGIIGSIDHPIIKKLRGQV
jgi:hypothetical protein